MILLAYTNKISYNSNLYKTCYYASSCGDWGKYSDIETSYYIEFGLVTYDPSNVSIRVENDMWQIDILS